MWNAKPGGQNFVRKIVCAHLGAHTNGGTGPKFCRFHKRGPPSPLPVESTKLRACTSEIRIQIFGLFVLGTCAGRARLNKKYAYS